MGDVLSPRPRTLDMNLSPGVFLALFLALCGAQGAYAGPPLAFYLGEPASEAGATRATELLLAQEPPIVIEARPFHLGHLLGSDGVTVLGASAMVSCTGSAWDRKQYRRLLDDIRDALNEVRLAEAGVLLDEARAVRPCLRSWVAPEELATADFLAGIHAFYGGDLAATREHFHRALVTDAELPWNPDYPPTAQQEFGAALVDVGRSAPATVTLHVQAGTQIWIDGRPANVDGPPCDVSAGQHVVQIHDPDGSIVGVDVIVAAASNLFLLDRATLEALGSVGAVPDVVPNLLALARDHANSRPIYLVLLGAEPRVLVLDQAGRALVAVQRPVLPPPLPPPPPLDRRRPAPGPIVLAALGGAVMAAGVVFAIGGATEAADLRAMMEDPATTDAEWDPLFSTFSQRRTMAYTGYAMMAAGGTCLGISIPVGLASKGDRAVRASVTVVPPVWGGIASFGVSVTIE